MDTQAGGIKKGVAMAIDRDIDKDQDEEQETAPAAASKTTRPGWWVRQYTFTGTAVGLVFLWLSMTPSLLPRGPLFQALVSGGSGAIGYALGVLVVWLVRYMRSQDSSPKAPPVAWRILVVLGLIGTVLMIVWFHFWQDRVRDLMGVPRLSFWAHPQTAVMSIIVLFVLVEMGQQIRRLILFLIERLNRVAPKRVSAVVAVTLVVVLAMALINGVVVRVAMDFLNNTFSAVNNEENPDNPAPTTSLRSGGPGSLVSWASLGNQGRAFVGGGATAQELSAFNKTPATEPIRAYAGLESADGIKATAELAARET